MEAILEVLSDGKARNARQILGSLPYSDEFFVNKKLVNSILSSEAKRYVVRDNRSYTYRIRAADEEIYVMPPFDLVSAMTKSILKQRGPLSADELQEALEGEGLQVPKFMIKGLLSDEILLVAK